MADRTGGELVYDALVDSDVKLLVGLPGTQTLPLDRIVVQRDEMEYLMARHETAVPHIAWGYYETTGRPAATLTVPGPGDTNAMHGLKNAYEDCVPILHVSADADPAERGKNPIHEIEPDTFDNVVKQNVIVEDDLDLLGQIEEGIVTALTPPYGPVRLGIPSGILAGEVEAPTSSVEPERVSYENDTYREAVDLLANSERPVIYAGGGSRRSPEGPRVVQELATTLDAPVITSYKGKGVFPEDDDRWLGVTGSPSPAGMRETLAAADVVLALGTDFDGVTTAHWDIPLGETLIHVNLDSKDVNAGYEANIAIIDDVTHAGDRLLEELDGRGGDGWNGAAIAQRVRSEYEAHLRDLGLFNGDSPANTPELLTAVRAVTPRESPVTTDVGGFRLWAMQLFETYDPNRVVTAGSWAGMGVGLPAAIGVAAGRNDDQPVICLTGDGGLMMCIHELHTAAEYGLNIVVVVSDNADYGIISKSPKIMQYTNQHEFTWNRPNFAEIANGFGVRAASVDTAAAAGDAVEAAVERRSGPELIDVTVRTEEPSAIEAADYKTDLPFS
ncbi:thiamine pyrophosphate-binding protein [Haladaptatus salinisoli]|uniref:thiamine pyrophosphate-binding protein n=1 Tax=Haladaptatus salinisoli TaxID=2884876 RepID=UPI001D09AEBC|nr:thiamine pyrophosphate-binding protein [Haladaptatus salinisoli]